MLDKTKLEDIPTPPKTALVGNMFSVDKDNPLQSLMGLCREHGPLFKLDMMGKPLYIASGAAIVEELCDESRFDKAVRGSLRRVRAIGGDGLFTGDTVEPNWSKAHNILLPTFSRQAMNNYMPMMLDVATQLVTKWERLNADDEIDVVHDMTAVALDTIGICGFNYRFNSFYRRDYHPFIDALTRTLETCMMQRGLPFEGQILRSRLTQMEKDVGFMNKMVDDIIRERRRGGGDGVQNDLLNYMLQGVDKVTGESLSDENIRYQINTFLIAGHETTSGLMSFTLYFLLNHPDVLEKAYREVDTVLGRDISIQPTIKDVNKLTYIQQILYEALRLYPTAPAFGLYPYEDEIVGGKYLLKKGSFITALALMLHRDQSVWGPNADEFDPEQFSKEAVAARPINAYKPFGNGQRACIGRQFAMQEATLVIGMILQRFQLFDHNKYELKIKESLSIKPDGFMMRVRPRPEIVRSKLVPGGLETAGSEKTDALKEAAKRPSHGTSALILYGSNLGTTEDFAREMARLADANGFDTTLAPLDDFAGKLPKTGLVAIACASYNGRPPDNATQFVEWLEGADAGSAEGVKYVIFGCGHSDWAATFQATPRIIDQELQRIGATRIGDLGEGDARDAIEDQFEEWISSGWSTVADALGLKVALDGAENAAPLYTVEEVTGTNGHPIADQTGAKPGRIVVNRELQNPAKEPAMSRSTRHVEIALPEGMSYRPGDHLSVVPANDEALVAKAARRFGYTPQTMVTLASSSEQHSQLPTGQPISLARLLGQYVELQAVASRKDMAVLARHTECPRTKPDIEALAGDHYREGVFSKKRSALDILFEHPACELPLGAFLEIVPSLSPRYYSISSSPSDDEKTCSITVAVVNEPAISGNGQFKGVCSNYLAERAEGEDIHVSVRLTKDAFRMPEDPETPIIMIGPGTGIAPFRGFLQERAHRAAHGTKNGPAILFFGCRTPDQDFIYQDELEAYQKDGLTELHVAFSRVAKDKAYVQDLIRKQEDAVWSLIDQGAKIFVCGDGSRMEPDVRRTLALIYSERTNASPEAADAWINGLEKEGRYALDVWASN
ncbi:MAG: cytochrome P450 [Pseudomonadota bacterium]